MFDLGIGIGFAGLRDLDQRDNLVGIQVLHQLQLGRGLIENAFRPVTTRYEILLTRPQKRPFGRKDRRVGFGENCGDVKV